MTDAPDSFEFGAFCFDGDIETLQRIQQADAVADLTIDQLSESVITAGADAASPKKPSVVPIRNRRRTGG